MTSTSDHQAEHAPGAGAPGSKVARLGRFVPGMSAVRTYQPAWLSKDIVAGLVLASLLVPQGMAYAELAGLPAITGLYTSILCLVAYAVFGPSRILVLGPDSSLGPMIAATILPLAAANGDPAPRGRLRVHAGAHRRRAHAHRRRRWPRVHRRPALQADPDRLHERPRPDDLRRPAAEAVRVLDRRGRAHRPRPRPSCRASPTGRWCRRQPPSGCSASPSW